MSAILGYSQSLPLLVKPITPIVFNPTTLYLTVSSSDFVSGNTVLLAEVHDSAADRFDTTKYVRRQFTERSLIGIPSAAFSAAFSNGKINVALFNQYLSIYNMQVDTAGLRAIGSTYYP